MSITPDCVLKILAIIPAYNESAHIANVVKGVLVHVPVLVVDDGSIDNTALLAEEAGATVIRQQPNQGKGEALKTGFRFALKHNYDAVIQLDADGQHDPTDLTKFINLYRESEADMIIGERDFKKMPFVRRASNTIGRFLLSWAVGQPIRDNQSGYRLVSRRLILACLDSMEGGYEYEVEMILKCLWLKCQLKWVPVRTIYADEKSHIRPLIHAVNYLRLMRAAWKHHR